MMKHQIHAVPDTGSTPRDPPPTQLMSEPILGVGTDRSNVKVHTSSQLLRYSQARAEAVEASNSCLYAARITCHDPVSSTASSRSQLSTSSIRTRLSISKIRCCQTVFACSCRSHVFWNCSCMKGGRADFFACW